MTILPMSRDFPAEGGAKLIDWVVGAGDDTQTFAGKISYLNRLRTHDGNKIQSYATLEDLAGSSAFRGGYSAKTGALPIAGPLPATPTIDARYRPTEPFVEGHFVLITEAGTISGIDGADTLPIGSLLYYLGGGAAVADSWHGIASNLDLTPFLIYRQITSITLNAGVATRIAPPSEMKTCVNFLLLEGNTPSNQRFEESFESTGASIGLTVKSLTNKSNLLCNYTGLTI